MYIPVHVSSVLHTTIGKVDKHSSSCDKNRNRQESVDGKLLVLFGDKNKIVICEACNFFLKVSVCPPPCQYKSSSSSDSENP